MSILRKLPEETSSKVINDNPEIKNNIDKHIGLSDSIQTSFGVDILGGKWYTLYSLSTLHEMLETLPSDWVNGLTLRTEYVDGEYGSYYYNERLLTINVEPLNNSRLPTTFLHELGHHVDSKFFNYTAFQSLFEASNQDTSSFAYEYGMTNSLEDAASTFEKYLLDAPAAFQDALNRARNGNPMYLTKLLTVLDITTGTTKSEIGSTTGKWYGISSLTFNGRDVINYKSKDINIERNDLEGISAINGVNVYIDGSYNIDGLDDLLEKLQGE